MGPVRNSLVGKSDVLGPQNVLPLWGPTLLFQGRVGTGKGWGIRKLWLQEKSAGQACFSLTPPESIEVCPVFIQLCVSVSGKLLEGGNYFSSFTVNVVWWCYQAWASAKVSHRESEKEAMVCRWRLDNGFPGGEMSWFVVFAAFFVNIPLPPPSWLTLS